MGLYSALTCYEEHASQGETYDLDGVQANVILRCPWATRHAVVADIVGNQRVWPHGGFGIPPTASSASIVPDETDFTVTGQSINYVDALVTVNYDTEASDLISESLEPVAEFITLDHRRFRWGAVDGEPLLEAEAPGMLTKMLNVVRTHFEVSGPLSPDLLSLVGACNLAQETAVHLGLSFAAETLLYNPPSLSRMITTAGAEAWTITLKYTYKPNGWNKYWRAKTESWVRIYEYFAGAYNSYPPISFTNVWSP